MSLWGPLLWTTFARSKSMGFSHGGRDVHRRTRIDGEINISDPDGIVTDARWFASTTPSSRSSPRWVPTRQPFVGWLQERWSDPRTFDYSVEGDRASGLVVELLSLKT